MTNYDILFVTARLVKSNQGCGGLLQGPRKGSKFLHSILSFSGSVQLYGLLLYAPRGGECFWYGALCKSKKNKNGTHRLTTDASRFLFYPVFPANPQQFLASIAVAPPVLLGYTVISVPPHGQRAMYQRAASQAAKGGFCYEISGFNLRGSSRFVFWVRSCTPCCRCPSRPASMA